MSLLELYLLAVVIAVTAHHFYHLGREHTIKELDEAGIFGRRPKKSAEDKENS